MCSPRATSRTSRAPRSASACASSTRTTRTRTAAPSARTWPARTRRTTTFRSSTPTSSTSATRRSATSTHGSTTLESWEEPNRKGVDRLRRRRAPPARRPPLGHVGQGRRCARAHPRRRAGRRGGAALGRRSARSRKPRLGTEARQRVRVRVPAARARRRARRSPRCACRRPLVVLASAAAGLAGAVELARGHLVAAALLVQLKTVLDNADGQLARLTDRVTALRPLPRLGVRPARRTPRSSPGSAGTSGSRPRRARLRRAHGCPERQLQPRAARARLRRRPGHGSSCSAVSTGLLRLAGPAGRALRRGRCAAPVTRPAARTMICNRRRRSHNSECRRSSHSSASASPSVTRCLRRRAACPARARRGTLRPARVARQHRSGGMLEHR